jgi:hypothetical protein
MYFLILSGSVNTMKGKKFNLHHAQKLFSFCLGRLLPDPEYTGVLSIIIRRQNQTIIAEAACRQLSTDAVASVRFST